MNVRTTKPGKGNKFYITKSKGGYSTCIQGKPVDANCNVLSNCVGYACGRFNEIIGSMKYPSLNCNAENFIERAKSLGLKVSDVPVLGGIMVWQKGTLSSSDGVGHVAIVEKIIDSKTIYTSESSYGGKAFYNSTRSNSNGRWGAGSAYKFRGCIINPSISTESKKKTVNANGGLYLRKEAKTTSTALALIKSGTKVTIINENVATNGGYKWDKVSVSGKTGYMANKYLK